MTTLRFLPPKPAPKPSSRILLGALTIFGTLALLSGVAAVKGVQIKTLALAGKAREKAGPPPETVTTAFASGDSWESIIASVGTITASQGVAISADVAGIVRKVRFESGQTVRQGDVLIELDSSVERAQLATAVTRRKLAAQSAERTRMLATKGAVAQQQIDSDDAMLGTTSTEAAAVAAQIARKTIRAPFSGKVGMRAVNLGQFLTPGTAVTMLESAEARYVDFSIPQQRLEEVAVGMKVRVTLDGSKTPLEGVLAAVDSTVEARTRTIRLRATLPTGIGGIRSGSFVKVAVLLPARENLVIAPATAIVHAPYGDSVFVVENKKARQQFVRVGETRGELVSLLDGVKIGQELVTSGAFKLRNGSPVAVDPTAKAQATLDPRPENR